MKPVLDEYASMFHFEAQKCYDKLKKPNCYTVEDLEHEGILLWLKITKDHPDILEPDFRAYFKKSLINLLNNILISSYKCEDPESEIIDEINPPCSEYFDPATIAATLMNLKSLSNIELQYIKITLAPDEETQKQFMNFRRKKQVVREKLEISHFIELNARKSIKEKLTK